ncbi:hypothetical protein [Peribacillus simplex]|uniref:hypothetical protein n=1 Tax=Peribacillus simplex TaxID=1478 RepID=UPI003D270182
MGSRWGTVINTDNPIFKTIRIGNCLIIYYRLHVVPIHLPPLRNRVDEIPPLVHFFLQKYNTLYKRKVVFTPDAIDLLCIYQWPGNVRELENTVERLVITSGIPDVDVALVKEVLPF